MPCTAGDARSAPTKPPHELLRRVDTCPYPRRHARLDIFVPREQDSTCRSPRPAPDGKKSPRIKPCAATRNGDVWEGEKRPRLGARHASPARGTRRPEARAEVLGRVRSPGFGGTRVRPQRPGLPARVPRSPHTPLELVEGRRTGSQAGMARLGKVAGFKKSYG
jgi:hypothetical protein